HLSVSLSGRAGRTRHSRAGPAEAAAGQWQAASRPRLTKDTGYPLLARQLVKKYFTPRPAAGSVAGNAPEALHRPCRTPATRSAASLRSTPRPGRRAPAARLPLGPGAGAQRHPRPTGQRRPRRGGRRTGQPTGGARAPRRAAGAGPGADGLAELLGAAPGGGTAHR